MHGQIRWAPLCRMRALGIPFSSSLQVDVVNSIKSFEIAAWLRVLNVFETHHHPKYSLETNCNPAAGGELLHTFHYPSLQVI